MLCYDVLFCPKLKWRVEVSLAWVFSGFLMSFTFFFYSGLLYVVKSDMISIALWCPDLLGSVMLPYVLLFFALCAV